jgi:hypothetical protein
MESLLLRCHHTGPALSLESCDGPIEEIGNIQVTIDENRDRRAGG